LEQISAPVRLHPEVLQVRYHLYEATRQWELAAETAQGICQQLPEVSFGWIHQAYALHELKRTREAFQVLRPVLDSFPEEHIIPYNLACYACQLGNAQEALDWLHKAIALAGAQEIKKMALSDPDLQPLRAEIERF
ncbi:MAG TPA: tetratricopeptide repeat protein, partial [Bacillota bacterium]|nr:tetratricopeptide repeat protein [Bacillota bacterium]